VIPADAAEVRRRNLDRDHRLTRFFHAVEAIEAAQAELAALVEISNDPLTAPERRCEVYKEILRLRVIVRGGGSR